MIRTFDGLEVDAIEPIPAHNLSAQTTDLAHGGYWNCELTGGGCVQHFGDELLVGPDAEHLTLVSERSGVGESDTKTATRIRDVKLSPDRDASQAIYRLDPPLDGHDHVLVSAVTVALCGPETYIFGSDENGNIEDWVELHGSYRGGLDHAAALANAGYEVAS